MSEEFKKLAREFMGHTKPYGMSPIVWEQRLKDAEALQIDAYNKGVEDSGQHMDKRAELARKVLRGIEAKREAFSYEEYAIEIRALKLPKE